MAAFIGKDVKKLKSKGGKWKYLSVCCFRELSYIDTDLFKEKEMIDISAPFAPYRSLFMWYMVCACEYLPSLLDRYQGHNLSQTRVASGSLCLGAFRKTGPCQRVGLFKLLRGLASSRQLSHRQCSCNATLLTLVLRSGESKMLTQTPSLENLRG